MNGAQTQSDNENVEVLDCKIWAVEPKRGDLFVLRLPNEDFLIQVESGIFDRPERILNRSWKLKREISGDRNIVALLCDDEMTWMPCHRFGTPTT